MTRPRLILAIRCVTLLCVGALLLGSGWLYAGLASVLVGLMMPVFAVVSTTCPSVCSNMSASVSFTTTGITDAPSHACDCSHYNTTVVSIVKSGCIYTGRTTVDSLCGFFVEMTANFTASGGNSRVTLQADGSFFPGIASTGPISLGASALDCAGLSVSSGPATHTDGACLFSGINIAMVS